MLKKENIILVCFLLWFKRDDPVTEFSLRQFSSSKDLKPAVDKIIQKGGLSNVGK